MLKVKLAKALVWSIALYGYESWTMRKNEEGLTQTVVCDKSSESK